MANARRSTIISRSRSSMEDRFTKEVRCVKIYVFDEKRIGGENKIICT